MRSSTRVMVGGCWPVGVLAVTATGLVLWLYVPEPGTPGGPDVAILGTELLILCAHIAAGYAVGRAFPVVIAVPLATMGSFLVTTAGLGLEPAWIRHIGATNLYNCCTVEEIAAPEVLFAACVFAVGVIVSAVLIVSARVLVARVAAVLPGLAGTAIAVWLVLPLDWEPTAPRDLSAAECTDGTPRVCTWPEQESSADTIQASVTDVLARFESAGIRYADSMDPITFAHSSPGRIEIVATMVGALLPTEPADCPLGYPEWYFDVHERMSSWLYLTAGLDAGTAEGVAAPENVEAVRAMRSEWSPAEQLSWYEAGVDALRECPQGEPPAALRSVTASGGPS
ncbi:DUF7224 domain-containing protein [Phytoactinopolyspora halotolerans]|uniref:DUF7224 domain-containing protein n=1 Tax=Phytoactinopolyspora halotolerans TaxID=1981512 RepID=UPI001C2044C8|nr:hypothetical protein [Phytoactinopolyspora halotolerans]